MRALKFEEFLRNLSDLTARREGPLVPPPVAKQAQAVAQALRRLKVLDHGSVAELVKQHPEWVPLLAASVRIGDEQLKRQLRHGLGTSGWVTLARKRPIDLVAFLDEQFGLLAAIGEERKRSWTFGDVLAERYLLSRRRASGAVKRGRAVEDAVEAVVKELGLEYRMRSKFVGSGGQEAPCDLAIPQDGANAQIVIAAKGFNSTGSKLSDAVREIETIASVRLPTQFIFVVIDGIGWLGRQADLRRIYKACAEKRIDGLYSLATLDDFTLRPAASGQTIGLGHALESLSRTVQTRRPTAFARVLVAWAR